MSQLNKNSISCYAHMQKVLVLFNILDLQKISLHVSLSVENLKKLWYKSMENLVGCGLG
jgi:hypothetical protein